MHYFQWNIGDYIKSTAHLTNEEDLAYRRALELYYDTESPLDTQNIPSLSRRLRVGIPELTSVINEFFPDGKNKRADAEIAEYHAFLNKQKNNGKLGGRPKKEDKKPKPNPEEPKPKPNTNHKPLNTNQDKSKEKKGAALPPDFLAPEFISSRTWRDWVTHRIEIKSPMTESIARACIEKLTKFHVAGHDVDEIILNSIAGGWSGLFEPNQKRGTGPPAEQQKSKGRQAIELLEGLKHGMDAQGNRYGSAKADMPRLG